jgi:hypothetical protein
MILWFYNILMQALLMLLLFVRFWGACMDLLGVVVEGTSATAALVQLWHSLARHKHDLHGVSV